MKLKQMHEAAEIAKQTGQSMVVSQQSLNQQKEIQALKINLTELEADFERFKKGVIKILRQQLTKRVGRPSLSQEDIEQLIKKNGKK